MIPEVKSTDPQYYIGDIITLIIGATALAVFASVNNLEKLKFGSRCIRYISLCYTVYICLYPQFRAITIICTGLPGPAPHCSIEEWIEPQFKTFGEIFTRIAPWKSFSQNCGDLIYSGHTSFTFVIVYSILLHVPKDSIQQFTHRKEVLHCSWRTLCYRCDICVSSIQKTLHCRLCCCCFYFLWDVFKFIRFRCHIFADSIVPIGYSTNIVKQKEVILV